jgi:acyl carrier protein
MDQVSINEIKEIIADVIEMESGMIEDDAHFINDLEVDSLLALEILARMEKRFEITISEEELFRFTTVRQVMDIVKELLSQKKEIHTGIQGFGSQADC